MGNPESIKRTRGPGVPTDPTTDRRFTRDPSLPPVKKKRDGIPRTQADRDWTAEQNRTRPDRASYAQHASISVDKPLTELQLAAAHALADGNNVSSAAARTGIQTGLLYRYLKQPNFLAVLAREKEKIAEANQMTRKKVMDGLLEAIDMAKLMAEPATMVSGWREIAKMCGYMEPVKRRLDININGTVALERMNQLSDSELLKLITQDVQQQVEAIEHEEEAASDAEYHEQAATPPGPTTPLDALIDATKEIDE